MAVGVSPGSFDPLTIAHVALAAAALDQLGLERVDLAVTEDPLGKAHLAVGADDRVRRARAALGDRPGLSVVAVRSGLIAELAVGYDAVVLGADKWAQVLDVAWYRDRAHRDRAVASLPIVAVAPRAGHVIDHHPGVDLRVLEVPGHLAEVSATAVRAGRREWAAGPEH